MSLLSFSYVSQMFSVRLKRSLLDINLLYYIIYIIILYTLLYYIYYTLYYYIIYDIYTLPLIQVVMNA